MVWGPSLLMKSVKVWIYFAQAYHFLKSPLRFEINLGMLIPNTNEPLQKLSEKAMDKYMDIDKHKDSTVASSAIFVTNFGMYP